MDKFLVKISKSKVGNIKLADLSLEQLNNRHVCNLHFKPTDFNNIETQQRLKQNVIPIKYDFTELPTNVGQYIPTPSFNECEHPESPNLHVKTPTIVYKKKCPRTPIETPHVPATLNTSPSSPILTYECSPSTSLMVKSFIDMPSPISNRKRRLFNSKTVLFPNEQSSESLIKRLEDEIRKKNILLKKNSSTISKLRKKLQVSRNKFNLHKFKKNITFSSLGSKVMAEMQMFHKRNSRSSWTLAEKNFAINLYYKSPATYKFLRNNQQIILPGETTLRRWIGKSKFCPGFNSLWLKQIKIKLDTMSDDEKYCVIIFDEMKIKSFLEYSKYLDMVEGFEDLGHRGRTNKLATQAMVFMVRGLYSNWKLPLAYFLSGSSMSSSILKDLITDLIEKCTELGFNIVALVCDQGSNNYSAIKHLGCCKEKPFIEIKGKTIFTIFDVPHIFKNLRNNFLKYNFKFNGQEVSFSDIKLAYNIDKSSCTSRALLKLTDSHMNPNPFQKMNCKLALQVFSNSVAAVLKTCIATGQIKSKTATATADFVQELNNLFDCLNSKTLYSFNIYSCALNEEKPYLLQCLMKTKEWWTQLELIQPINVYGKVVPCFDAMIWSINAIIMIYTQQQQLGFKYLLTSRLNQDVIENTFSVFRQRGGFNRNPTARTFRTSFRFQAKHNLMKATDSSNCENDFDYNLFDPNSQNTLSTPHTDTETLVESVSDSFISSDEEGTFDQCLSNNEETITLETCSNTYFAGYLAKKCIDQYKCNKCELIILKNNDFLFNDQEYIIFYKQFESADIEKSSLKTPSDLFVNLVSTAQKYLKDCVELSPHKRKLCATIQQKIKTELIFALNFDPNCEPHIDFIVQKLIHCKLLRHFNWTSKHLKGHSSLQTANKLKILKNV
ncbi:hypothetical protein QTP88_010781 [Uroleucon formosanum]